MTLHQDLTSIHLGAYVASSDPGAVGADKLWVDTSSGPPYALKKRNGADSGWEDVGASGGGSGDVAFSALQASQLVNEFKGWQPIVPDNSDLDALKLWWRKIGTPTVAPTVVDVAGAGLTATYKRAIKVQAAAANDGMKQTWTYANEPRLKSGRKLSVLLAIWSVSSVSVTAKLVNSDASHTDASAVTAAAWTIVEVPNHTLAGSSCNLEITAGAAGTFYVVPLGANVGARAFALPDRPLRFVDKDGGTTVVSAVDPGSSWQTADCASATGPLAARVVGIAEYQNTSAAGNQLKLRRKGASVGNVVAATLMSNQDTSHFVYQRVEQWTDDAQCFEYIGSGFAGDSETVNFSATGYWEWA